MPVIARAPVRAQPGCQPEYPPGKQPARPPASQVGRVGIPVPAPWPLAAVLKAKRVRSRSPERRGVRTPLAQGRWGRGLGVYAGRACGASSGPFLRPREGLVPPAPLLASGSARGPAAHLGARGRQDSPIRSAVAGRQAALRAGTRVRAPPGAAPAEAGRAARSPRPLTSGLPGASLRGSLRPARPHLPRSLPQVVAGVPGREEAAGRTGGGRQGGGRGGRAGGRAGQHGKGSRVTGAGVQSGPGKGGRGLGQSCHLRKIQ